MTIFSKISRRVEPVIEKKESNGLNRLRPEDINVIGLIGKGSFGKVYLVELIH